MKKTLIVVDMQNDFIDMALGTKEAVAIVPKVKEKIQEYVQNGDEIIFTRDTHSENYLQTPEGKKLPVEHCIQNNILKDFLHRHRAEVTNMILEEFDLNKYLKLEKAESYEEGHKKGREEGELRLATLTQYLINAQRYDDLTKSVTDREYRHILYQEFHIT